jgi:hypothetical protein
MSPRRQVGEPVVVEVPGRHREPELVKAFRSIADLGEQLPPGRAEAGAGGAVQDADCPRLGRAADTLDRGADRQISGGVVVEVAHRQRGPEEVAGLHRPADLRE